MPSPALGAGDILTSAELRELREVSTARGVLLIGHAWAVILGAMVVHAMWPSLPTLLAGVAIVGSRQLGLMVLMHEAAHWRLFNGLTPNGWAAKAFCAWPMWVDLKAYRRQHHLHHRHTQQPDDPDRALAAAFPVERAALWRAALADLCGVTALRLALGWPGWREPARVGLRRLRGPVLCHAVLAVALVAAGHWALYPLLWLLPQLTWYRLVARLRSMAEHAMVPDDDDPLRNSRTTSAGPLARAFLAPYWVNYHLEHHLLVFVPCWRLGRAHALLVSKGYGPRMEVAAGYLELFGRATSRRRTGAR